MARIPLEPYKYIRDGEFELMSVKHGTRSGGIIGISFLFS